MQLRYINVPALIVEAGGDPWAINQTLQAGRPTQIVDLAQAFRTAGRCTGESKAAFGEARRRFAAAWTGETGEHPINDSMEARRVHHSLGAESLHLPKIGVELQSIAAALAKAQRHAATNIAALEGRLQQLDREIGQAREYLIFDLEQRAIDNTKSTLSELQSLRMGYTDCLQGSLSFLSIDGHHPTNPEVPITIPRPGTGAQDVHRWWISLPPDERQRTLTEHPDQIGNLNGVPVSARSVANVAVMTRDLNRVRDIVTHDGVLVADVIRNPENYGLTAIDITRFQNADQTQQGLEHDAGTDPSHPNATFLFAYDPLAFGGKGRAAIAIGNPDTAKNTAVIVPGATSSVSGGWLQDAHNDAVNLFEQANAADPTNFTAVMAWMGYDAPNDAKDPRIATPMLARAGGQALARDVNGLWTTHLGGDERITVVGHSYGSTTVADGFVQGMRATDAVLLGSPGTDLASNAKEFHVDGGHVYVGATSTDPVSLIGESDGLSDRLFGGDIGGQVLGLDPGLGTDPAADGFGSVRFRAEVPGSNAIDPKDHSYYYHRGSEALHSMADIVSGHGDALASDGMLARARHQPRIHIGIPGLGSIGIDIPGTPASIDPEWSRSPGSITDNHVFDNQHHH
jgi:hypothetical protein